MDNLLDLTLIWGGVFLSSLLARRTKLTPVLFFLATGAFFVNVGWLPVEPTPFIRGLSELGIILIMFSLGFEESTSAFFNCIKRTWGIAVFGALVPFCVAYFLALYFWQNTNMAILCGLAMTATAVSLTMVTLKNEGLHKTRAATGIMTSAVLDNVAALALVAILVPMAAGAGPVSLSTVLLLLGKTAIFFLIIAAVGEWVFPHDMKNSWFRYVPILGRYGIGHVFSVGDGENTTLAVLLIAVLAGILSYHAGFHPAVGAYMAGLILKEEYFHFNRTKKERNHYIHCKDIVDDVAFSWIGPIFFVTLGTKLLFDWDIFITVIPQIFALTTCLIIGQVGSAALAARYTGGFSFHESVMIGLGMLGRAELAFIVMDIAYVQHNILSIEAFYTLMFTAFWMNIVAPISIKWWAPRFLAAK